MKQYRDLLFDLDGTLIDSHIGVTGCFASALTAHGIKTSREEIPLSVLGPPLEESFRKIWGLTGVENEAIIATYRAHYKETGRHLASLYPGIPEMLDTLLASGYRLSVATTKLEVPALAMLREFGIADRFAAIAGADDSMGRHEKCDVIRHLFTRLDALTPEHTLMIGDRFYDAEGARAVGIDCLGVLWGFGSEEELARAGAVYLSKTPLSLAAFLTT